MATYDNSNRSEQFGKHLSAAIAAISRLEGKTEARVQDDLAQRFGLSGRTVERWKKGFRPRDPEVIKSLAEAGVRRGLLNKVWAERFLYTAGFPEARELLEVFFPQLQILPQHGSSNMPRTNVELLVARPQALAEVMHCLRSGALTLITGAVGSGKSTLARVIGQHCRSGNPGFPAMDAVVWVSDRDHPGSTSLNTVLDTIARVLSWPAILEHKPEEKAAEVIHLLAGTPTLLIIDSYETITDPDLAGWLHKLLEPSQVLITSSEIPAPLRDHALCIYELPGMSEHEAQALITQRLGFLGIQPRAITPADRTSLIQATNGNPKLIEVALGILRHERRTLNALLADLEAARGPLYTQAVEVFFTRAHNLLDETGQQLLLALTLFPAGATAAALAAVTDIPEPIVEATQFQLSSLGLVETNQAAADSAPRYTLHSLVRHAVDARYAASQDRREALKRRRIGEAHQLVRSVVLRDDERTPHYWNALQSPRMDRLDPDWPNVEQALSWALAPGEDAQLLELVLMLTHYMNLRVLYNERERFAEQAIEAARRLGRPADAAILLIDALGWMFIELERYDEARAVIERGMGYAQNLPESCEERTDLLALGYAFRARERLYQGDLDQAWRLIESAFSHPASAVVRYRVAWIAGDICLARGDYQQALRYHHESDDLNDSYGAETGSHSALMIGFTQLVLGQLDAAERRFVTMMTRQAARSAVYNLQALYGLACVAARRGEYDLARTRALEARAQLQRLCHTHRLVHQIDTFLKSLNEGHSELTIQSLII